MATKRQLEAWTAQQAHAERRRLEERNRAANLTPAERYALLAIYGDTWQEMRDRPFYHAVEALRRPRAAAFTASW